jgi:hypothetical protein
MNQPQHPWLAIPLDVYEVHMSDPGVGQLQLLHEVFGRQLADTPARRLGVLGVAGGNGLDLVDLETTDAVVGYDINPDYLASCEARYRPLLGDRLRLVQASLDRSVVIEPVDLLIANLLVEYVGAEEFVAFVAANAERIGVLSVVVQRNGSAGFISASAQSASFDGLASVSSEVDADALSGALAAVGFTAVHGAEHPLPNGKVLVRRDFRTAA